MKKMFGKNKRQKKEVEELDITSLLDVLVILLVFLLKSYNASDLKVNLVDNLKMANSESRKLGNHNVIVQVDKEKKIWINKEQIATYTGQSEVSELKQKLEELKQDRKIANDTKKPEKINLIFDKDLPYEVVKTVMHTSAVAGFKEFKFIVSGNY